MAESNPTELTLQQEQFCRLYTQNRSLFGNATLAYAEAYDYRLDELSTERPILEQDSEGNNIKYGDSEYTLAYNVCAVCSCKLLRNAKINDRITELLNEMLTDKEVDAELASIILKGEKDSDKIAAIREYNKLKQRIVERTDLTSGGEKLLVMPNELINKNESTQSSE